MDDNPKILSSRKLTASSLATPIFHRRRRDWRDDQYLIQDCVTSVLAHKDSGKTPEANIQKLLDLQSKIESEGYQSNATAMHLAMWFREQLAFLAAKKGGYDLRVHTIYIPENIENIILKKDYELSNVELQDGNNLRMELLFPDPKIRGFALERIQLIHKGSLLSYLSSLVCRERDSLNGESATIMDLIHICEEKIKRRKLETSDNLAADEFDLWIPSLSLGVEIRDELSSENQDGLVDLIRNSSNYKKARFVALVCPDDLSDLLFHHWRKLEKDPSIENLSVLRAGDFGKYLDRLIQEKPSI